ncbi:MAG: hypothetical protein IT350_02845 [Deltaproteobacteria bacterium]|nr:hypothetical protein [Deltaproteobacteria bacterium]
MSGERVAAGEQGQLDLFSGAVQRRRLAEDALDEFRLDDAVRELPLHLETYPRDEDMRARLVAATALAERLARLRSETADDFRALLALGEYVARNDLKKAWHRRVARDAEVRFGEGCRIDGTPAGLHWLDGGDAKQAAQSLRATLDATPRTDPDRVRILAHLGDAIHLGGDGERAGACYLAAFLTDPTDVDTARIANVDIIRLARREQMPDDIVGDWRDWIAPVGVVAGFFELPRPNPWGVEKLPGDPDLDAEGRPGLEFFRLLLSVRDEPEVARRREIRKRMKELCPSLFAEYRESVGEA